MNITCIFFYSRHYHTEKYESKCPRDHIHRAAPTMMTIIISQFFSFSPPPWQRVYMHYIKILDRYIGSNRV